MKKKTEIVTFKADSDLFEALHGIPNRSNFIRKALLNALENCCPLCGGNGTLTPMQKEHWQNFTKNHSLEECDGCNELHIVCDHISIDK